MDSKSGFDSTSECGQASYLHPVVVNKMLVVDTLKDPELIRDISQRLVVVRLQRDLLHGHDVAGRVVDGRVDLAEVALPDLVAPLPGEGDRLGLDVDPVFSTRPVQDDPDGTVLQAALLALLLQARDALHHALGPGEEGYGKRGQAKSVMQWLFVFFNTLERWCSNSNTKQGKLLLQARDALHHALGPGEEG